MNAQKWLKQFDRLLMPLPPHSVSGHYKWTVSMSAFMWQGKAWVVTSETICKTQSIYYITDEICWSLLLKMRKWILREQLVLSATVSNVVSRVSHCLGNAELVLWPCDNQWPRGSGSACKWFLKKSFFRGRYKEPGMRYPDRGEGRGWRRWLTYMSAVLHYLF